MSPQINFLSRGSAFAWRLLASQLWLILIAGSGLALIWGTDASNQAVAMRTIVLGLLSAAIAIPLGAINAWICRGPGVAARVLLLTNIVLLLLPLVIQVSAWDAAFGKLGWLTSTRGQVLVPLVSGWTAAAWIHGIAAVPQVALILLIGLGLNRSVEEEQALLDASPIKIFFRLSYYRWVPLMILAAAWIMISTSREIAVTDLYQIGTLAEQIYLGYSLGINSVAGNWSANQLAEAGEISAPLTWLVIAWLALVAVYFFFRLTSQVQQSNLLAPIRIERTNLRLPRLLAALSLLLLMGLIPVANVILRACFYVRPVDGVPVAGYSAGQLWTSITVAAADYQDEFVWSTLIAMTSALAIILLATLFAAMSWGRRGQAISWLFSALLALTAAIPGPVIGTQLATCFSQIESPGVQWLYNYTIAAPVIANLIFCWPLGAMVVWFVFQQTPRDAVESFDLEGAGWCSKYLQFGLIANWLAILGCLVVTFAICFGELSASQIVRPAGMDTVSRKMLGDLHAGVNELTAGITIVTACMITLLACWGWWLIGLNQRRMRRSVRSTVDDV